MAVQAIKLWVVWATLEEVALCGGRGESEGEAKSGGKLKDVLSDRRTYQLVQSDLRSIIRDCKPPRSSSHSGSTYVAWKQRQQNHHITHWMYCRKKKQKNKTARILLKFSQPPIARYLKNSQPEIRGSLALRGGFSIMSRSGGLKPRAVAGRPSVTRLTQSSWTGIRASGNPRAAVRKMLSGETIPVRKC